jgi:hypothetical protein
MRATVCKEPGDPVNIPRVEEPPAKSEANAAPPELLKTVVPIELKFPPEGAAVLVRTAT